MTEVLAATAPPPDVHASLRQIYNFYRTCLLNVKYYGFRLAATHRLSMWADIVVVLGSATSGVSGWAVWSWGLGRVLWLGVAAAATVIAAVKPVLQLNKKIELYGRLFGGHNSNYLAMKDLVERIQTARTVTAEMLAEYRTLYQRHVELAREDEPYPSRKLLQRFQMEVQAQIPAEQLWWAG